MNSDRPASLRVLAALGLCVGTMAFLGGGGCLAVAATGGSSVTASPVVSGRYHDPAAYLRERVLGYRLYELGRPATTVLVGLAWLAAAAGLRGGHRGARRLALGVAVVVVALNLTALLYEIGYVLPALEGWQRLRPTSSPAPVAPMDGLWVLPVVQLGLGLVLLVHALGTLLALLSPAVTEELDEQPIGAPLADKGSPD